MDLMSQEYLEKYKNLPRVGDICYYLYIYDNEIVDLYKIQMIDYRMKQFESSIYQKFKILETIFGEESGEQETGWAPPNSPFKDSVYGGSHFFRERNDIFDYIFNQKRYE